MNIPNEYWRYRFDRSTCSTHIAFTLDKWETSHSFFLNTNVRSPYCSMSKEHILNVHKSIDSYIQNNT